MQLKQLKDASKILLYGYGREGKSSERFIQSHCPNVEISIHDDATSSQKPNLTSFDVIIVSPGVSRHIFPVELADRLTSNTEIFFHNLTEPQRQKIIGITGTKGKSSTCKFLHELLQHAGKKSAIGGNYGIPLLDLYAQLDKLDYIVAELSSYQLENLDVSPHIAILLNIYPDHLDRHGSIEEYKAAKTNLWTHQTDGDHFFQTEDFSPLAPNFLPTDSLLQAEHFRQNLSFLSPLCTELKITPRLILSTAQNFQFPPHRLQHFITKNGIDFYDDAIATNPHATLAAVQTLGENLGTILLGGQNRGIDYTEFAKKLSQLPIHIILFPSEITPQLAELLSQKKTKNYTLASSFADAVDIAFQKTPPGKACLLSTAAPSYDQFKNFEEQGDTFQHLVREHI